MKDDAPTQRVVRAYYQRLATKCELLNRIARGLDLTICRGKLLGLRFLSAPISQIRKYWQNSFRFLQPRFSRRGYNGCCRADFGTTETVEKGG
jgi:hypothetical protein